MPMRAAISAMTAGEIADLVLGVEQHGDQRRPTQRVERHQAIEARGQAGTKDGVAHRVHDSRFKSLLWRLGSAPCELFHPIDGGCIQLLSACREAQRAITFDAELTRTLRAPAAIRQLPFPVSASKPRPTERVLVLEQGSSEVRSPDILVGVEARGISVDTEHLRAASARPAAATWTRGGWELFVAHRSISPSTMSIDPMTATTSARRRPTHIVSRAWSEAKVGLRICTR